MPEVQRWGLPRLGLGRGFELDRAGAKIDILANIREPKAPTPLRTRAVGAHSRPKSQTTPLRTSGRPHKTHASTIGTAQKRRPYELRAVKQLDARVMDWKP